MPGSGSITDFWASSIIIENGGELSAYGRDADNDPSISWQAFGFHGGVLTIHLYGKNEAEWDPNTQQFAQQNQGALCKSPLGTPRAREDTGAVRHSPGRLGQQWCDREGFARLDPQDKQVSDYFYQYGPLHGDGKCTGTPTIRCSRMANASNQMATNRVTPRWAISVTRCSPFPTEEVCPSTGYKGATYRPRGMVVRMRIPSDSGSSWMRLADGKSLEVGARSLVLEKDPCDLEARATK